MYFESNSIQTCTLKLVPSKRNRRDQNIFIIFVLQMSSTMFVRMCSTEQYHGERKNIISCTTIHTHIRVVHNLYCIVVLHCWVSSYNNVTLGQLEMCLEINLASCRCIQVGASGRTIYNHIDQRLFVTIRTLLSRQCSSCSGNRVRNVNSGSLSMLVSHFGASVTEGTSLSV